MDLNRKIDGKKILYTVIMILIGLVELSLIYLLFYSFFRTNPPADGGGEDFGAGAIVGLIFFIVLITINIAGHLLSQIMKKDYKIMSRALFVISSLLSILSILFISGILGIVRMWIKF